MYVIRERGVDPLVGQLRLLLAHPSSSLGTDARCSRSFLQKSQQVYMYVIQKAHFYMIIVAEHERDKDVFWREIKMYFGDIQKESIDKGSETTSLEGDESFQSFFYNIMICKR